MTNTIRVSLFDNDKHFLEQHISSMVSLNIEKSKKKMFLSSWYVCSAVMCTACVIHQDYHGKTSSTLEVSTTHKDFFPKKNSLHFIHLFTLFVFQMIEIVDWKMCVFHMYLFHSSITLTTIYGVVST